MPALRDIKRRIASVQSTRQITNTMKMVAAARLRRAQEALFRTRPYAEGLEHLIGHLCVRVRGDLHPLLAVRGRSRKAALVVVTSDRGLCGAFNSNVVRRANQRILERPDVETGFILVGKKGRDFFRRRGMGPVLYEQVGLFQELDFGQARVLADHIGQLYLDGNLDSVEVVYQEFRSAVRQEVVLRPLLPIVPREPISGPIYPYLYEPSEEAILDVLLSRYLVVQLWRVLLESFAAEQGARMTAMENATDNADEMIEQLTLAYNKARQAAITKEILEVAGGAEAMRKAEE
ncbi:MAG TPA: ATP synthase F1 subunit gamma [Candidatus Latescibacteria bacterium]|nr:ATP synthase F1 subunit gamma [Candidatus Latescibacterota bacterium]